MIPPGSGFGAPVVFGNVIGRFLSVRTARYAKACASIDWEDQPTASAVSTVADLRRSVNIRIRVGLRAPPPATIQARGGLGSNRTIRATLAAVKADSVAAPSATEKSGKPMLARAKALRSSDFGQGLSKNGSVSTRATKPSSTHPLAA